MEFRILGPREVVAEGGPIDVAAAKPRAVLAIWLLHASEPIGSARLVEELWGESPRATAAKTLQTCVMKLRRLLTPEARREAGPQPEPGGPGAAALDSQSGRTRPAQASPAATCGGTTPGRRCCRASARPRSCRPPFRPTAGLSGSSTSPRAEASERGPSVRPALRVHPALRRHAGDDARRQHLRKRCHTEVAGHEYLALVPLERAQDSLRNVLGLQHEAVDRAG